MRPPVMFFGNFPISYAKWSSTPIFTTHCHCNNNNNSWINLWMMSEIFKDIGQMFTKPKKQEPIPYMYAQNMGLGGVSTYYPYVNLNNTQRPQEQGEDEELKGLKDAYKNCRTKFNFVKVNNKYMAITKDGHRLKADTADALMDLIDEYIQKGSERVQSEEQTEQVATPEGTVETPEPESPEAPSVSQENPVISDNERRSIVPQGWKKDNNFLNAKIDDNHVGGFEHNNLADLLQYNIDSNRDKKGAAAGLVDLLMNYYGVSISDSAKKTELVNAIKSVNPSVFNEDGSLVSGIDAATIMNKLDVPSKEVLQSTYGATQKTGAASRQQSSADNSAIGSIRNNIKVGNQTYSQGAVWKSGNMFYKNQTGSWSSFDRDAILLIDNNKFTLHRVVSDGFERGEAADYGDLLGINKKPDAKQLFKHDGKGHLSFLGNFENKFAIHDKNGKTIGYLYSKNGKATFSPKDSKVEYDMEKIMTGDTKLSQFQNIK